MQPVNLEAASVLSEDVFIARRIAFAIATVAVRLGLPSSCDVDLLLQSALEQPEKVAPDEYRMIYMLRSPEVQQ